MRKAARLYFDEDLEWSDEAIANIQKHIESSLIRLDLDLTWDDVEIKVYYYGGGIEDDPDHGKYQRGAGFYAEVSVEVQ